MNTYSSWSRRNWKSWIYGTTNWSRRNIWPFSFICIIYESSISTTIVWKRSINCICRWTWKFSRWKTIGSITSICRSWHDWDIWRSCICPRIDWPNGHRRWTTSFHRWKFSNSIGIICPRSPRSMLRNWNNWISTAIISDSNSIGRSSLMYPSSNDFNSEIIKSKRSTRKHFATRVCNHSVTARICLLDHNHCFLRVFRSGEQQFVSDSSTDQSEWNITSLIVASQSTVHDRWESLACLSNFDDTGTWSESTPLWLPNRTEGSIKMVVESETHWSMPFAAGTAQSESD